MRSIAALSGETPPALAAKPEELPKRFVAYVDAYKTLANSRAFGGMHGIGPVPLSEIKAYTELFYVEDVVLLIRVVRELDNYFAECAKNGRHNFTN